MIACVCNPIFINTSVVFVRLYWFEKRFQSVVLEAQRLRRTRERSRSKSEAVDEERSLGVTEPKGIGKKKITVMRPDRETILEAERPSPGPSDKAADTGSDTGSSKSRAAYADSNNHNLHEGFDGDLSPNTNMPRAITFADEVPATTEYGMGAARMPAPRSKEEHIAFVEKQNKDQEGDTLYIPGPRDFDRGAVPQHVHGASENSSTPRHTAVGRFAAVTNDDQNLRDKNYSIDENVDPIVPERSKTTTSDSAIVMNRHDGRLISRLKEHIPFSHHDYQKPHSESNRQSSLPQRRTDSPEGLRKRERTNTFASFMSATRTETKDPMPYLTYQPTIGRNSAFVNLSEAQREELGGIEYRALKLLATVLCCYFVGFHILGLLSYLPWIESASQSYKSTLDSDGINYGWWGVFTSASMFNDLGFTLTPDSMDSFADAVWILLMGSFLIIIGNTGFPCMLRFTIWVVSKVVRSGSPIWEELHFLLDHPRRCFTLLFPSKANWWLFWVLVLLNGIDLIFFVILDLKGTPVSNISGGLKFLDGLFQAASTRTAGFAVTNLADLHPAIQVSYLVMMYISVFPIAISVRRTNVYEEKSLGVYSSNDVPEDQDHSYVGSHLRRQLSFDLWYVFLGLFIISIVEGDKIQDTNDWAFTIFSVLFEVVSAYGTVGLSLGYPNTDASFSSQFRVISKLVIIAMQLRGRHRGLPYALDKAVLLPSEGLQSREEQEAKRRQTIEMKLSKTTTNVKNFQQPISNTSEPDNLGPMNEKMTGPDQGGVTTEGEGAVRDRGYSLGRLISNALGAGPTMSRKID